MLQGAREYLKGLMLLELLRGMNLTGRYFFKTKFTVQYPEEKAPISPRFRLRSGDHLAGASVLRVVGVGRKW